MFTKTPSLLFGTAYSATSTNMSIGIAGSGGFAEITAAEANATNGDSRQIIYGIVEGWFARYSALPEAQKSTKFEITRSRSFNADGTIAASYNISFVLSATGIDVNTVGEPG